MTIKFKHSEIITTIMNLSRTSSYSLTAFFTPSSSCEDLAS